MEREELELIMRLKNTKLLEEAAHNELLRVTRDAITTERHFEKFLRDAGFSREQSKAIVADGFKSLSQRDADTPEHDDWTRKMRERLTGLSAT